jgi:transcription initiation factor IIF auxiliary subunit
MNYFLDIHLFLDMPETSLTKIKNVKYVLHSTFADPIKTVEMPNEGFKLKGYGWGEFAVKVEVTLRDDSKLQKYHWLELIGSKPLDV